MRNNLLHFGAYAFEFGFAFLNKFVYQPAFGFCFGISCYGNGFIPNWRISSRQSR